MKLPRGRLVWALVLFVLAGACWVLFVPPRGPRSLKAFDPERTAALEVDMWKAYYEDRHLVLFADLATLTHEQYHYTWYRALRASLFLARAASTFAKIRSDYEQVLPDLERAYAIARDWTGSTFDPAAVARAELAWWVARRDPAGNSPESVGALIAEENALIYGVPRERVLEASILRARAGRLRDEGGEHADWAAVARLLMQSYRRLHDAVNAPPGG
jgi:hypothetical protein